MKFIHTLAILQHTDRTVSVSTASVDDRPLGGSTRLRPDQCHHLYVCYATAALPFRNIRPNWNFIAGVYQFLPNTWAVWQITGKPVTSSQHMWPCAPRSSSLYGLLNTWPITQRSLLCSIHHPSEVCLYIEKLTLLYGLWDILWSSDSNKWTCRSPSFLI